MLTRAYLGSKTSNFCQQSLDNNETLLPTHRQLSPSAVCDRDLAQVTLFLRNQMPQDPIKLVCYVLFQADSALFHFILLMDFDAFDLYPSDSKGNDDFVLIPQIFFELFNNELLSILNRYYLNGHIMDKLYIDIITLELELPFLLNIGNLNTYEPNDISLIRKSFALKICPKIKFDLELNKTFSISPGNKSIEFPALEITSIKFPAQRWSVGISHHSHHSGLIT